MKIKLIKFREDLLKPIRKHYNDAGIDCYAQEDITLQPSASVYYGLAKRQEANGNTVFIGEETIIQRFPEVTKKIPLGFGIELPTGYVALIKPRSSMNVKGIVTYEGVIDSGYRGEISAVFSNLNSNPITFHKGDRICQLVIMPIAITDLVEDLGDERGEGGFGSTGE